MKRYFIIFIISGCFVFAPKTFAAYLYARSITVTSTTSVASGTLTNFPMLVSSTLASWETSSTAGGAGSIQNLCTAPNGGNEPCDLIFATSTACNALNFETEKYVSSTGALIDWVNVPTMQAGTNLYACYGNSAITTDQSHPSSTWNSNYQLVMHLPNGTILNATDSTSNANNGTLTGTVKPSATTGEIDGGASFNGNDYINAGNAASLYNASSVTVEAWVNLTAGSAGMTAVSEFNDSGASDNWALGLDNSVGTSTRWTVDNVGQSQQVNVISSAHLSTSTWNHVVGVFASSSQLMSLYINGALSATGTIASINQTSSVAVSFTIGARAGGPKFWNGSIDEVRYSNAPLSSSWILTDYNNQNSPSTFYAIGSQQTTVAILKACVYIRGGGSSVRGSVSIRGGGSISPAVKIR